MERPSFAFEKWEGLGNDFVVVSGPAPLAITPERARELCDRRRGIGADGVLLVEVPAMSSSPSSSSSSSSTPSISDARPRMIVFNADGSRPEMCGNGLRCVAAFLASQRGDGGTILVATDAGDRSCTVQRTGADLYDVTVDMGAARIGGEIAITIDERGHRFTTVDVGNPHAITFEPYEEAAIDHVGPIVATSVEGGTNVEFCRVVSSSKEPRIEVVVWERGVGRTLACGTGACAVAAAACETGRAPFGSPIRVALPGGELVITVAAGRRDLSMRGPARRVFAGEVMGA